MSHAHTRARTADEWPLAPRRARTFYNVADAWHPAALGAPDLVAALAPRLRDDPAARARLERALAWLEWSPRLLLRSRHGLSWLARDERRAWLARCERGGGPLGAAARHVRAAVEEAWAAAAGAAEPARQSLDGA